MGVPHTDRPAAEVARGRGRAFRPRSWVATVVVVAVVVASAPAWRASTPRRSSGRGRGRLCPVVVDAVAPAGVAERRAAVRRRAAKGSPTISGFPAWAAAISLGRKGGGEAHRRRRRRGPRERPGPGECGGPSGGRSCRRRHHRRKAPRRTGISIDPVGHLGDDDGGDHRHDELGTVSSTPATLRMTWYIGQWYRYRP